jgi:hypothetical protein
MDPDPGGPNLRIRIPNTALQYNPEIPQLTAYTKNEISTFYEKIKEFRGETKYLQISTDNKI